MVKYNCLKIVNDFVCFPTSQTTYTVIISNKKTCNHKMFASSPTFAAVVCIKTDLSEPETVVSFPFATSSSYCAFKASPMAICIGIKIVHTTAAIGKKICTPNCATLKNANPSKPAVCMNSLSLTLNTCTIHPYKNVKYAANVFTTHINHSMTTLETFLGACACPRARHDGGISFRQSNELLSYAGGGCVKFLNRNLPKYIGFACLYAPNNVRTTQDAMK